MRNRNYSTVYHRDWAVGGRLTNVDLTYPDLAFFRGSNVYFYCEYFHPPIPIWFFFFFEIPHPLTLTVYLSLTNSLRKNPPPDPMRPRQGDCFSDQYLNVGLTDLQESSQYDIHDRITKKLSDFPYQQFVANISSACGSP